MQSLSVEESRFLIELNHGEENAIRTKEITKLLGIEGNQIRALVNSLRTKGVPVGSTHRGYFICKNYDELEHTINHLSSRVKRIQEAVKALTCISSL